MSMSVRSPFGALLREVRSAQGISQAELAKRISDRFESDPTVAELGVVSDRAIANLEAPKSSESEFVRPRPETVRVLMLGLGIDPTSERGKAMLRAAGATRRRERTQASAGSSRYQTPFVHTGREIQWAALEQAWEIAQTGQPQIRLIEGTAGMGKTRLVEEFCAQINKSQQDVIMAPGECSSGTATVEPYLPWRRAFSSALRSGIHNLEQTPQDIYLADALIGSVAKLGGVLIEMQDLENWFASRAPERLPELRQIRETWSHTDTSGRYDEFVSIISQVSAELPIIVVLEDLHWADESSCSLLLHLQRQMRLHDDMPILVIGTYRTSDLVQLDRRHPLQHVINEMQRQIESVVISLETTVDSDHGKEFVRGLVASFALDKRDHDQLITTLYERTQGHPLFTTELIQHLVSSGALYQNRTGKWKLEWEKIETHLPGKMRAIIDERIQRLPDDARTVLEAASVQGSPFAVDILPAVSGISEAQVDVIIDRELLEKHRLFKYAGDGEGEVLEFDHEVIAETVYQSLSPHRRRSLHRRTAEAFISANPTQPFLVAPKAAHHFELANMPAEAAEQSLLTSFATLAKLDHDLTLVWVDRSEELARAANNDRAYWLARVRRAHVYRSMGRLSEAYTIGQEAARSAQQMGDISLEADANEVTALVAYDWGHLEDASEAWVRSVDLYQRLERHDRVSANQSMLSHVACRTGRLDAAIRHAKAAWASAPNANRDGLGAEALLAEGNALLELGRYEDAIEVYTRSRNTYGTTGEMRGIVLTRLNIALATTLLGDIDSAMAQFADLEATLSRLQTPRLQAFLWFYYAKAFEAAGNFRRAKELYSLGFKTRVGSGLDAMAGDDLAGVLRAAIGLNADVEGHLDTLQSWWRTNDPRALEDPLLAILSLVQAYDVLGNRRMMVITLNEGTRMFLDRAGQIQNPAIRDMYLRGNRAGSKLLELAQEAGLVEQ